MLRPNCEQPIDPMQSKAPRFELGIKDLQSSPYHLAMPPSGDFPPHQGIASESSRPLLVLSNGHGEDLIALRILEALPSRTAVAPKVMPLVGEGRCFQQAVDQGWRNASASARLPSGDSATRACGPPRRPAGGTHSQFQAVDLPETGENLRCRTPRRRRSAPHDGLDMRPDLCIRPFKSDYTWSSGPGSSFSDRYHALKGGGTEWT